MGIEYVAARYVAPDLERLKQLELPAQRAISEWNVEQQAASQQLCDQPDYACYAWWMGYLQAIRDVRSGSSPQLPRLWVRV